MSNNDEICFEVSIELSWGTKHTQKIGPYSEEDIDEYGEPPQEDVNQAVWEIIDGCVGVRRLSETSE